MSDIKWADLSAARKLIIRLQIEREDSTGEAWQQIGGTPKSELDSLCAEGLLLWRPVISFDENGNEITAGYEYQATQLARKLWDENVSFQEWNSDKNALVSTDGDSGDPLTEALLEGDYAGIRKMFEELKAERDSANKRRSEVDADAAALRSALEYYTDAEIVTNWGSEETEDNGAIARDALRSTAAGVSLTNRLEYLEGMNLGRERVDAQILELVQKHAPYVEYEELASPQLVEAIDKHISEMAVRITELTQPKQAETLEQLEARAMEFVKRNQRIEACKVFRNANYSTSYANAAVNRMFDNLPTYTQLEAERDELKAMLLRSEQHAADLSDQLYAAENDPAYVRRDVSATISGLEDTCVDLVKLVEKRNRQVRYWMGLLDTKNYQRTRP